MAKPPVVPAKSDPGMVVYQARGGDQVQLSLETVKNFLITGNKDLVTVQEMVYFIGICKARGLNPFAKDCYLVKYSANETAAIITAIDFYRSRAKAQPDCVGWEKGVIVINKESGELRYSKGLVLDNEEVVGGYFRAHPKGWELPWELEVNLREFQKKTKEGNITAFWKNPAMMIAKVAESQGLRTLWPDEFRGTLAAEEMGFHSDQFAAIDELPPPPAESKDLPPSAVDLGQYNTLVQGKKLSGERLDHLEEFLKQTASSQKKTKMTVDQLKEKAGSNFPGFFAAFEKWEGVSYPPSGPVEEPPSQADPPQGVPEPEHQTGSQADTQGAPEGAEEDWSPAQEPEVVTFEDRVQKIWHTVISKGIPLSELKVGNKVIQRTADFTPENIDEIQKTVEGYKPPRGRK